MYRITWLTRRTDGTLALNTVTTPNAAIAVTIVLALKLSRVIAPRLWTRRTALIPC